MQFCILFIQKLGASGVAVGEVCSFDGVVLWEWGMQCMYTTYKSFHLPVCLLFCKMQLHFDLAKLYSLNIHYFYWLFTEIQTVFALRSSVIYLSDLHHSQQFHSSAETQVFRIHSVCTMSSGQHSYKAQTHCVCLYATSVSSFKSSLETFLFSKTFPSVPLPYACVCARARACACVRACVSPLLSIYNVCLKNW